MEEASTEVNWIPTVQTFVAVIPATPPKTVPVVPISRLLTTCQLVPFQCSVSVSKAEAPVEDPTAQMSVAETTATAPKPLPDIPTLGLETTLQLVPFQCSISVCLALLMPPEYPTAQMSVAETTATPLKLFKPFKEVSMLGLETTFQLVPFQCSVSVSVTQPVLQELEYPTAQMSLAETTATAVKKVPNVPTLGLETTFQLVPFHCSISVCWTPPEVVENPTAQTSATPFRTLFDVPTLGLETTFQLVPFQCSINVWKAPLELVEDPTAQTSVAETAATPFS